MDYPELAGRTRRFGMGAPRSVTVSSDGRRVVFLRSAGPQDPMDRLYVIDVPDGTERLIADPAVIVAGGDVTPAGLPAAEAALRERLRLSTDGIASYATDPASTVAVFTVGGQLYRADLDTGAVRAVPTAGPAVDPRPDPTGQRIAYVTDGSLRVIAADGQDSLLAGPSGTGSSLTGGQSWGLAEFIAAEEFDRFRGYWWSPDGGTILAARVDESRVNVWHLHDPADPASAPRQLAYPTPGTANAEVTLHLLDLDGGWVDVHWDRETYPYLVNVAWSERRGPLVTVLRRLQQHGLVLAVDPRTGETQVHAELADPRWVSPIPGSPAYLGDGRVMVGGELAHDGYDARCLFADGSLLTPPGLYVRRVCGQLAGTGLEGPQLLVEASEGEPGEQHLYLVSTAIGGAAPQARRISSEPGWHVGAVGGDTIVQGVASLEHAGTRWRILHRGVEIGPLANLAAAPPYAPRPTFARVTDRRLPTGVLYPRHHVDGRKLPVLVDIYGGPGHQEVVAARTVWLERQWWADNGFAVVVIDNRGTSGVAPSFEKAIHRRFADVILADQVDALAALADKHADLDLNRVAIRGWSFGGWLAALAVLRRPDVYHAASAGAPVADWSLYTTAYTERYLGLPTESVEVYQHNSLLAAAAEPVVRPEENRPLLLIHGLVDDNVVAAHSLRLSAALLQAGRHHALLPVPGASHMAAADRLLHAELHFLRTALA
jgi:dipeptidyl-peptidase-4